MNPTAGRYQLSAQPVGDPIAELKALMPGQPGIEVSPVQARALIAGAQPWIFTLLDNGAPAGRAFGMLQRGRLRCGLTVTLTSEITGRQAFWDGILDFVSRQAVTQFLAESITPSAPGIAIPQVGRESERYSNIKLYTVDLERPDISRKFSKNHKRNIGKARKSGMQVVVLEPEEALRVHFDLEGLSLTRRAVRGEPTNLRAARDGIIALLASGAGRLYQAALNGEVMSSKLVYTLGAHAYYHAGGTSPRGMDLGASHFLMHEIMCLLKDRGIRSLNLDVASIVAGGLGRYKEGFGPDLWIVERVGFDFTNPYKMIRNAAKYLWRSAPGS